MNNIKKFKKIYIEITNQCNLNCSFCSKVNRKKGKLSSEQFETIINKIKLYTDTIYLHVKGEPLLHPLLSSFLDIAEQNNIRVNITTNGTLLKQNVEMLASKKSLRKLNISLHAEQNIPNYYEDVFKAVEILSQDKIIVYRIWTLQNGHLDEKSTHIVDKLISYYHLSPEVVEELKQKNHLQLFPHIYVDKANFFEWPSVANSKKKIGTCYALKTHLAILVDGTVVPCCLDGDGDIPLGNIFTTDLDKIIASKRYKNLKESLISHNLCEELCKKCTYKERF